MTQQITGSQQTVAQDFCSLDSDVDRIIQAQRRSKTGDLAAELTAAFKSFGFFTKPHPEATRTAVIGVHPDHPARVQAILAPDHVIYTRDNGRAHNIDEPPVWNPSPSNTSVSVYQSYLM